MLKFKNFYIKMKYNCIKNVLGIKLLFNNIEIQVIVNCNYLGFFDKGKIFVDIIKDFYCG